ncbi:MAG: mechanosensitive ion channel family protein [Ruminococcaceae bacterium]|nr:mechanosensitive ion channel family protein [Oscillospiraceae bacterium]
MNLAENIYLKVFGNTAFPGVLTYIAIAVIFYIVLHSTGKLIEKKSDIIAEKLFRNQNDNIKNAISKSLARPVKMFVQASGMLAAFLIIPFSADFAAVADTFAVKIYRIALIAIVGMLAVNLIDSIQYFSKKFENNENETLLMFFIKIGKVLVIFLAGAIILKEIGFDVTGLLASLGLGGVVLALAAQDTASNLFSGIVILFDKPFAVGDWISVAGMEGVVEEMSFRSCRIRTFDNALIAVPNSKLGGDSVTNWTKMNVRKTRITIGLVYGTKKDTLQKVCDEIKANLLKYDSIKKDNIMVWFDNFNASSLDIVIQYHTYLTGAADYFALKEEIQYMIMDVVEANKTDFAFNTQTIIIDNQ